MVNIRFVDATPVDGKGSARSKGLSAAERRHVRLAAVANAHRKDHVQDLQALQALEGYKGQYLLTTDHDEPKNPSSEATRSSQPHSRSLSAKALSQLQHAHNRPSVHFDRLVFKSGTSLDQINATPYSAQDLTFLQHVLETNNDCLLLEAALQYEAVLYGLLAMTSVYQDSAQGKEASSRSLIYKSKAIKLVIPLLGQESQSPVDVRVAAVAALTTIDLLEARGSTRSDSFSINAKGLRAALHARSCAPLFPRQEIHQGETVLDRTTEWLLLMLSMLNTGQQDSYSMDSDEQRTFVSSARLGYDILAEIKQIFDGLSAISIATDIAISRTDTLQFSLGNSAATDQFGLQVNKIENSVRWLASTVALNGDARCLLDVIRLTTTLYINMYIRQIPKPAALNSILASRAIQSLQALCSHNPDNHSHLLYTHGHLGLFAFSMLTEYMKWPNAQVSFRKDAWTKQLYYVYAKLCNTYGVNTSDSLLATVRNLVEPTNHACAEIKQSFEKFWASCKQSWCGKQWPIPK